MRARTAKPIKSDPMLIARCSLLLLLVAAPALDVAEADPRFGAFDFSSAYEEAPADLQELLDSHESLPFRRRG